MTSQWQQLAYGDIWRLATCGHGLRRSSNNNNGTQNDQELIEDRSL